MEDTLAEDLPSMLTRQSIAENHLEKADLLLYAAPLQGYTEAEWRHYHAEMFGGVDAYYIPFMRVEKGSVRNKDMREITSPLNPAAIPTVPQVLVHDSGELRILADAIVAAGHRAIDINMGCPFAPQVKHGRGSALLASPAVLESLAGEMRERYADVRFSVKMRLGVTDASQWRDAIGIINAMPLTHVTVHPRTAVQQYEGELAMEEFAALIEESAHPVVFNGNILSPKDIDSLTQAYPRLQGIMVGRGLLTRPSLFAEWRSGEEWDSTRQLRTVMALHDAIYESYRTRLCGDAQLLSKIKPFWDYHAEAIGHKAAKAIKKATSVQKYEAAVATIR